MTPKPKAKKAAPAPAAPIRHRCALKGDCQHCNGTGWIGDIKCPACG